MIKFNGMTEKELGIVIEEPTNILGRAPLKYESFDIEGRNGSIDIFSGYSSLERQFKVQIVDVEKIDLIFRTFMKRVKIEYQGRYTFATFTSNIDIERWIFLRKTTLSFNRDPFWYVEDEYSSDTNNSGTIDSKPIIKIIKGTSTKIDCTIAGVRFKYTFPDKEDYVEIDCNEKKASCNGLSRNRQLEIGWEFPIFEPGENKVVKHSGNFEVLCKGKDCWL